MILTTGVLNAKLPGGYRFTLTEEEFKKLVDQAKVEAQENETLDHLPFGSYVTVSEDEEGVKITEVLKELGSSNAHLARGMFVICHGPGRGFYLCLTRYYNVVPQVHDLE